VLPLVLVQIIAKVVTCPFFASQMPRSPERKPSCGTSCGTRGICYGRPLHLKRKASECREFAKTHGDEVLSMTEKTNRSGQPAGRWGLPCHGLVLHRRQDGAKADAAIHGIERMIVIVHEILMAGMASLMERKFLGLSISNDGRERRVAPKALDKFKGRIRDMTRRTRGLSLQQLIKELKPYIVGWRGYFGFCQTPRVLTNPEAWIRRTLRLYLWRQWRTRQNRFAELRRRGVAKLPAAVAAGSPNRALAHVRTSGGPASPTQRLFRVARSS
jgi:hypothetical protein